MRQIALSLKAYKTNECKVTNLTPQEITEINKINSEFLPNIFKLSDSLYAYDDYFLPINHFTSEVFFYKYNLDILEPQTLVKIRQKDIIDAGAYIEDTAILFEREFCDKNIYSFELTQTHFKLMQRTLKLNKSKRIIPINKGLGAKEMTMRINVCGDGSSIITHCISDNVEDVKIITLDSFINKNKIEVGFIKVDIEGAEMDFLKGAKETICTQKPTLLISLYHLGKDYFQIKPLIESWNLGYTFKIHRDPNGYLTLGTALFCEVLE